MRRCFSRFLPSFPASASIPRSFYSIALANLRVPDELHQCHYDLLECIRRCAPPSTERGLVPCAAPGRLGRAPDETPLGVHRTIVVAFEVVRDPHRRVDLDLAVAAEVDGGTGAQVTAERPVLRVPQGAPKWVHRSLKYRVRADNGSTRLW